jgi:hypothetical protein
MSISWLSAGGRTRPKTDFSILDNVHVAAPCPADWNKMAGDSHVRHCCECNLNVYNLSEMTRKEAENLIRTHEGRLCVRYYRRADGTILTQNCPVGLKALVRRISRIAAAVITAATSLGPAFAQSAMKGGNQTRAEESKAPAGFDLTVMDQTGALIPNAKAILCQCKSKGTVSATTDPVGVAHFAGLKAGHYEVEVQAPGFKTSRQNLKLQTKKVAQLQVKLKVAPTSTTVNVAGGPVTMDMGEITTISVDNPPTPLAVSGGRLAPLR